MREIKYFFFYECGMVEFKWGDKIHYLGQGNICILKDMWNMLVFFFLYIFQIHEDRHNSLYTMENHICITHELTTNKK